MESVNYLLNNNSRVINAGNERNTCKERNTSAQEPDANACKERNASAQEHVLQLRYEDLPTASDFLKVSPISQHEQAELLPRVHKCLETLNAQLLETLTPFSVRCVQDDSTGGISYCCYPVDASKTTDNNEQNFANDNDVQEIEDVQEIHEANCSPSKIVAHHLAVLVSAVRKALEEEESPYTDVNDLFQKLSEIRDARSQKLESLRDEVKQSCEHLNILCQEVGLSSSSPWTIE